MTNTIINPGSGPVEVGPQAQSEENIKAFIADLGIPHLTYKFISVDDSGRHNYQISNGAESHDVSMPAIPLDKVRYIGGQEQNIWHYPRLYVDGSSWVWKFALNVCFDTREV